VEVKPLRLVLVAVSMLFCDVTGMTAVAMPFAFACTVVALPPSSW
jgi:hypothetical protein